MLLEHLHKVADHVSTTKTAVVGGAGSAVSLTAAMIDPNVINPWLQMITLLVGLATGVGSGGLVLLKYLDRRKRP